MKTMWIAAALLLECGSETQAVARRDLHPWCHHHRSGDFVLTCCHETPNLRCETTTKIGNVFGDGPLGVRDHECFETD